MFANIITTAFTFNFQPNLLGCLVLAITGCFFWLHVCSWSPYSECDLHIQYSCLLGPTWWCRWKARCCHKESQNCTWPRHCCHSHLCGGCNSSCHSCFCGVFNSSSTKQHILLPLLCLNCIWLHLFIQLCQRKHHLLLLLLTFGVIDNYAA